MENNINGEHKVIDVNTIYEVADMHSDHGLSYEEAQNIVRMSMNIEEDNVMVLGYFHFFPFSFPDFYLIHYLVLAESYLGQVQLQSGTTQF